ncbi:transposable element Tc3 transposase [Trichonephila clavipes]|nr:transposable element Tc3 transposase [Trichonephila clavipes]
MINGRTRLHVVANGAMTGQRYIDEVLLPHVCLFRGAVGDKFVFMDDNAACHRTFAAQDYLDSEGIQRLVWPVRSPDLNPIENVWDALGRQVAGRNYPPTNKNTLIRALTEEWDKLPQQLLDNVVQKVSGSAFISPTPLGSQGVEGVTSGISRSQWHPTGLFEGRSTFPNPEIRVGSNFRVLPKLLFSESEHVVEFLDCIEKNLTFHEIPENLAVHI